MDKPQALKIVESLRQAQVSGAPVVELEGDEARNFAFVKNTDKVVLGTFRIDTEKKFFVCLASTTRSTDDFQFHVFEKVGANSVLTTITAGPAGVVWTYSTSKQTGDNEARKKAFYDAAKSPSITIPYPREDISEFASAVQRAITLRRQADAAGGSDEDDGGDGAEPDAAGLITRFYDSPERRKAAASLLATDIRLAHSVNPRSWCVTNPNGDDLIRLNVGAIRILDLRPGIVRLAVDGTKLGPAVRASLGASLTLTGQERLLGFGDNGIVVVPVTAIDQLDDEVRDAHEEIIKRAATAATQFARFHRPEIVAVVESLLGEQLPAPASTQSRYWKISPGENAKQWSVWRDEGFIAIGWNKLGDLTGVSHDEFKQRAEEKEASGQVWKFRNIAVGDRVVANDGFFRVLGIGTVTGTYRYVEGAPHAHQIPVRWDDTRERRVEMKGWRATLIRLSQETFKQVESVPPIGDTIAMSSTSTNEEETELGPEGGLDFDGILAQLADRQLSFSAELVASYLLALQAKRFVLLSGISGTGKTRLAQEIAKMFGPTLEQATVAAPDECELVAKHYHLKYSRFIVPSELAQQFDALTNAEVRRIDLKVPGVPPASMALYKNPDGGNLLNVLLSGEVREWFRSHIKVGQRFLLSKRTNGDKEWLELTLPAESRPQPSLPTYELIPVRPDWTDSRGLLGFYNPLTKSYIETKTLRLLLRAHAEVQAAVDTPPRPFFLIFDEMNLARVEHYFSDFLSVMESGETIDLHDDPLLEEEHDIPRRLSIPKNVFVIGTVNVDETTYMFSPKVLDRAFVLEFNDVDLGGLAGPVQSEDSDSTPLALVNLEGGLKLRGQGTGDEWKRFETLLGGEARALFGRIHDALAIENRHFGYRVAREVARFVDLAVEQAGSSEATVRAALDIAVLAKILPKLHGSQSEIEATLKRLLSIATGDKSESEVFEADGKVSYGLVLPLPRAARKLARMLRRLRANGSVSFIE